MRRFLSRHGKINIVSIILILIVVAAIYLAIIFIPVYLEHYKLEEKLRAAGNQAHMERNLNVIRKGIQRELAILGLNLPPEAVKITKDPRGLWIRFEVEYNRVVALPPFGSETTLHFESHIEERL